MRIILGGRNTGKTNHMLKWLMDAPEGEHRVCVSHSLQESRRLMRYARIDRQLPLESWQFVSWQEVGPGGWSGVLMGHGGRVVLGFDNLDLIMSRVLGFEVGAISLGGDVELASPVPWELLRGRE